MLTMVVKFEGTAREIAEIARYLGGTPQFVVTDEGNDPDPTLDTGEATHGAAFVRLVLTRRPGLATAQSAILRTLYAADDWVSRDQLLAAHGWEPLQLAGMLGGLGKRIAKTVGYRRPSDDKLPLEALIECRKDDGTWSYRLLPVTRTAMEDEKIV